MTLTAPGPLRLYSMTELLKLPPPSWLIEDILPAGALVGAVGQSGHYKSFVTVDWAMSVATGTPWHGHKVVPGYVLYVAAEGGVGIGLRPHAWLLDHHIKPENANIMWLTESIPVSVDSENMNALFDKLNGELQRQQPSLIIIDTLARCLDGDENTQEDMGRFIGGVDRLRREFDATVVVVHHTPRGEDRERGSTAFRGAADTMVFVKRPADMQVEISCTKQKDAIEFLPQSYEMRTIVLPDAPDGKPLSSIVLSEPAEERNAQILAWIAQYMPEGVAFTTLRELAAGSPGNTVMSPATLKRRLVSLRENGEIIRENAVYTLPEAHPE